MTAESNVTSLEAHRLHRSRRAIVVIDVVDSVQLMHADEDGFVHHWKRYVSEVREQVLPARHGRLVKSLGDGMLLAFGEVSAACSAALAARDLLLRHRGPGGAAAPFAVRIGASVGEVIEDELDIYGHDVNLAARVATLAEPGQIVVTAAFCDELVPGLDADVQDLGDCYLRHLSKPVRAYRLAPPGPQPELAAAPAAFDAQAAIAVIPFAVADGRADQRVVADVLADDLIGQLSLTAELRVISRLSTNAFVGRSADVDTIASHLKVHYVLSGSLHVLNDTVIVSAELCETHGRGVVWTGRATGSVRQLVEPASELPCRLAHEVHQVILQREVQRSRTRPLPTLESFSMLLGAVTLMHRQSRDDFDRARTLLEHLSERHNRHAAPKAWLAKWHAISAAQGWASDQFRGRAGHIVERALAAEPGHALAWAIKGLLHGYVDADFDAAEAAYAQALANNPNESLAWLFLATLQGWRGRQAEASDAAERALALSPLDPLRYYFDSLAGAAMLGARRYDRAIELSRRSLRCNGSHHSTYRVLVLAQALSGDGAGARATAATLLGIDPGFSIEAFMRTSPWRYSPDAPQLQAALRDVGVP